MTKKLCVEESYTFSQHLDLDLDLAPRPTAPPRSLCKGGENSQECCRCFKKKTCLDDGCKEAFQGEGVCIDVMADDLSHIDTSVEGKHGLCKNKVNNNCCTCFRKLAPPGSCHLAPCSFAGVQGVCVGRDEVAPDNHVLTKGVCKGRSCSCWVPDTCRDPVCEDSMHGKCVPEGSQLENHKPSHYPCRSPSLRNCTCWTPHCQSPACEERGGLCLLPWDPVPAGLEQSDLVCNEALDCKCYLKKPCDSDSKCSANKGTCRYSDDPRPANEAEVDLPCCDQSTHDCPCKCYKAETPCRSKACQAGGGVCLLPGEPGKVGYGHKPGDWCDKVRDCKCHRPNNPTKPKPKPKCKKNKTCVKTYKGQCFPAGYDGGKPVLVKGKPFYCDKTKKCQCYRVPVPSG